MAQQQPHLDKVQDLDADGHVDASIDVGVVMHIRNGHTGGLRLGACIEVRFGAQAVNGDLFAGSEQNRRNLTAHWRPDLVIDLPGQLQSGLVGPEQPLKHNAKVLQVDLSRSLASRVATSVVDLGDEGGAGLVRTGKVSSDTTTARAMGLPWASARTQDPMSAGRSWRGRPRGAFEAFEQRRITQTLVKRS
jgi:hypothetical protein